MKTRNQSNAGSRQWQPLSALFVAFLAAGFACSPAAGADGNVDTAFGTGGIATTGLTTQGFELPEKPLVLPDGKILICSSVVTGGPSGSDFFVARFNADGMPDTSLSFDGKVTIDFDSRNDICNALALQADGRIVVAGSSAPAMSPNEDFAVARLNSDGSPDMTFGGGTGQALFPFDIGGSDGDVAGAVAIQPDGKILAAGWAVTDASGYDFAVVRLLPDGSRDTTFNSTGRVTVAFDFPGTSGIDQADAIAIDDQARILLGGVAETAPASFDFALARLLPNGQLDHSFDADGRATIGFDLGNTNSDLSYHTILLQDGRIVMVGAADAGVGSTQNNDVAIARLLPDGSPDAGFGIGGKVVVPFDLVTNGNDVATAVVEDSAGRLVVVGGATYDATFDFRSFALRLLGNGTLDGNFGSFGKKTYDFGGTADVFLGVALQGTQIIASGQLATAPDSDNFVTRLAVDLIFADGFE